VNRPRLLSLCTGYAGLDHAAEEVFDAELVAVSDIDPGANKILAHRYPNIPNLGDLKRIGWGEWADVEIMTAGYPCQPFSHAGKRAGTDDSRHIFPFIAEGIRRVGPRLVLLENVRGHLGLGFDTVTGVLSDIGYDTRWVCIRASDVGAAHNRERLFIAATPRDSDSAGLEGWAARRGGADERPSGTPGLGPDGLTLLPTPNASDWKGPNHSGSDSQSSNGLSTLVELLPTPAVNDMGRGKTVEAWDEWTARMKTAHGNGNGHGPSLEIEAMRLLPTPGAADAHGNARAHKRGNPTLIGTALGYRPGDIERHGHDVPEFGKYAAAIARQEAAFGHPAPPPTEPTGKHGAHRLSPRFVEFLMGCHPGWVTDVPGLSRNDQLKALGNGVVRQQAAAAIRYITADVETAVAS
jgi:DNA (cytosine-5)-methyltransferase 1